MLMVISPAKTLDYETAPVTARHTLPRYLDHSLELIKVLRDKSPQEIGKLMSISDKLAALNVARYGSWSEEFTTANSKQALLAFKGDVYTGLHAEDFSEEDFDFAQQHLRMLSGLYGVLRPLDLMQPYRLEMGTKLATQFGNNLYEFWGNEITEMLNHDLAAIDSEWLVNLASQEYFSSVRPDKLHAKIITPVFKDEKNGQYKVISFWAKKARGMMARFVMNERPQSIADLRQFNSGGYRFNADESTATELVFYRSERDQRL